LYWLFIPLDNIEEQLFSFEGGVRSLPYPLPSHTLRNHKIKTVLKPLLIVLSGLFLEEHTVRRPSNSGWNLLYSFRVLKALFICCLS
jgi:hypothetical protein